MMFTSDSVSSVELNRLIQACASPVCEPAPAIAWLVARVDETDPVARGHSWRVSRLVDAAARHLGMASFEREVLVNSALLHDVGKILVPCKLLRWPGPLAGGEFAKVQKHTDLGAALLAAIPALAYAAPVAQWHHERWDGCGYPGGLKGTEVPYCARFVSVLDALDAMTSRRSYSEPMPLQSAIEELRAHAGTQFDPEVVDLVCSMDLQSILNQFERNCAGSLCNEPATV